ncbi:MAG: hypothetical protein AAB019_05405 [Planctomycetota bacterium]
MKKILLIASIIFGIICLIALIRFIVISVRKTTPQGPSYEQRQAENEKEINERLIASCDLGGNLIYHLDYSRDGKYIALATLSGVEIRDGENLNLIKEWGNEKGGTGAIVFHPNSQILASGYGSNDGKVEIFSVPDGNLIKTIYTDTDNEDWNTAPDDILAGYPDDANVAQVSFSPNGKYLLTRTRGEWKVMVWETETWSLKYALRKDEERHQAEWAQFSPDSQSVYVSSSRPLYYPSGSEKSGQRVPADQQAGWISHYDLSNGQKIRELRDKFLLGCYRFYFSPDGQKILFEGYKKNNQNNNAVVQKGIWVLNDPLILFWLPNIPGGGVQ